MTGIVRCDSYDRADVYSSIRKLLDITGGLNDIIKPGMRVFLKCNLVNISTPDSATVTHPEVVRAVAECVRELGAQPLIGDSPGGPFLPAVLKQYYKQAGYIDAARDTGAELIYDTDSGIRRLQSGKVMREFTLTNMVLKSDAVISLGKLKTHGLTMYTGAVKNLFGCIPGLDKASLHARFPDLENFSNMLVDLCECVKPVYSIIDGIVGMEGEGPSSGDPRRICALIGGRDPYAVDMAGAALIGLSPEHVCTLARAIERGLFQPDIADFIGTPISELCVSDFKLPSTANTMALYQGMPFVSKLIKKITQPHPLFDHSNCTGCGVCVRSCPANAIALRDGRPRVTLRKCIRCFCCQELCPKHTVKIGQSLAVRLFS